MTKEEQGSGQTAARKQEPDDTEESSESPTEIRIPQTGEVTVDPRALPKRAPNERSIHPRRPLPSVPESDDGKAAGSDPGSP
jgi:hypothetical protein